MDAKLRILQRLSLSDPEAKERYIHELERSIGGHSDPTFTDACLDLQFLVEKLEDYLMSAGERIYLQANQGGVGFVYFLVEGEDNDAAHGLCLAPSTRAAAGAVVSHFGLDSIKKWSADPILTMPAALNEQSDSIFTWSIVKA